MKKLIFLTGNKQKFAIAKKAFAGLNIKLIQKDIAPPEIQSMNVEDIASFSVEWASKKFKAPVFVTDAGACIKALNGFPGPFVKYVNHWFRAEDYVNLMKGKKDRSVVFKDCLAYCEPGKKPKLFCNSTEGKITMKPRRKRYTPLNSVLIPDGYKITTSEMSQKDMLQFWGDNIGNWRQFSDYLRKKF